MEVAVDGQVLEVVMEQLEWPSSCQTWGHLGVYLRFELETRWQLFERRDEVLVLCCATSCNQRVVWEVPRVFRLPTVQDRGIC